MNTPPQNISEEFPFNTQMNVEIALTLLAGVIDDATEDNLRTAMPGLTDEVMIIRIDNDRLRVVPIRFRELTESTAFTYSIVLTTGQITDDTAIYRSRRREAIAGLDHGVGDLSRLDFGQLRALYASVRAMAETTVRPTENGFEMIGLGGETLGLEVYVSGSEDGTFRIVNFESLLRGDTTVDDITPQLAKKFETRDAAMVTLRQKVIEKGYRILDK